MWSVGWVCSWCLEELAGADSESKGFSQTVFPLCLRNESSSDSVDDEQMHEEPIAWVLNTVVPLEEPWDVAMLFVLRAVLRAKEVCYINMYCTAVKCVRFSGLEANCCHNQI